MGREDRRDQLLECARRVFAKKGYHDASVDDVIRAARVARGTFYNYFESKSEVFREVLEDIFKKIWETVPPIDTSREVQGQVVANLGALCALLEGNLDMARILLLVGVDREADRALARFYTDCRERIERALRKGRELGILGEGDPTALAICIMGILKEYWSQRLTGAEPPSLDLFLGEVHRLFESGWLREPTRKSLPRKKP